MLPEPLPVSRDLRLHSNASARKRTGIHDHRGLPRKIAPDGWIYSSGGKRYPVWLESTIENWCAERDAQDGAA